MSTGWQFLIGIVQREEKHSCSWEASVRFNLFMDWVQLVIGQSKERLVEITFCWNNYTNIIENDIKENLIQMGTLLGTLIILSSRMYYFMCFLKRGEEGKMKG